MLGKLFRHEWAAISRMLLPVHGFVLIFAVCSRIFFQIGGGFDNLTDSDTIAATIAALVALLLVIVICSVGIFTYLYIGHRFQKNIFGAEGYLTNTLPVTPSQIILSKVLTGFLWMAIDLLVVIISCGILFLSRDSFIVFFYSVSNFLEETGITVSYIPAFVWIALVYLLLLPFQLIIMLYLSAAVGNQFASHKLIASIGIYIGIFIIMKIIGNVQSFLFNFSLKGDNILNVDTDTINVDETLVFLNNILSPWLLVSILLLVVYTAVMFLGTRYIMTKRLNLQ